MSNFFKIKEGRPAPKGREQLTPQIDAEIVKKGHFWLDTSLSQFY